MSTGKDKTQVFILHARPMIPTPITGRVEVRHWAPTRGATFALKQGKFGMFYVAIAMCSRKDNYNRKIGKTIATQRLAKQKFWHSKKGLSSALDTIRETCAKHGYVLPTRSVQYVEETFHGKADQKQGR